MKHIWQAAKHLQTQNAAAPAAIGKGDDPARIHRAIRKQISTLEIPENVVGCVPPLG
jgi:hypothetical protein